MYLTELRNAIIVAFTITNSFQNAEIGIAELGYYKSFQSMISPNSATPEVILDIPASSSRGGCQSLETMTSLGW